MEITLVKRTAMPYARHPPWLIPQVSWIELRIILPTIVSSFESSCVLLSIKNQVQVYNPPRIHPTKDHVGACHS
jgi:hypothetical protein